MFYMIFSLMLSASRSLQSSVDGAPTTPLLLLPSSPSSLVGMEGLGLGGGGTNLSSQASLGEPSLGLSAVTVCTVAGYLLLILVTVAGNVLVILAFFRDPTLQAITNYWIVSLAVTDIALALSVMPLQVKRELDGGRWLLGPLWCDLFICLDVLNCSCSIYHLGLISLDRYLCVRFPIRYPSFRSPRRTLVAIAVTWLWCTSISLPRLWWKDAPSGPESCDMNNEGFMIFSSIISFYIPLLCCLLMYWGIYRVTQARQRKLKKEMAASVRIKAYLKAPKEGNGDGAGGASDTPLMASSTPHAHSSHSLARKKRSETEEEGSSTTHGHTPDDLHELSPEHKAKKSSLGGAVLPSSKGKRYSIIADAFRARIHLPFQRGPAAPRSPAAKYSRASQPPPANGIEEEPAEAPEVDPETDTDARGIDETAFHKRDVLSKSSSAGLGRQVSQRRKEKNTAKSAAARLTKKRQRQEGRTAKVVMIVMGSFVLLWLPFFLVNIIWPVCHAFYNSKCGITPLVWRIVVYFGYTNSAINPFIYTFFNKTFKRAIFAILRGQCRRRGGSMFRPR